MNPEILICFGKSLYKDLKPDWFLEARLNKTIEIAQEYKDIPIVLTGGKSHLIEHEVEISEAKSMSDFISKKNENLISRFIIEDKADSTVDQIIRIKTEIIIPNNIRVVGIITDEIHMPRAKMTTHHILGNEYQVVDFPAEVRISGNWRKALDDIEAKVYELLERTRFSSINPGDHEHWKKLNLEWKNLPKSEKEQILQTKL